MLAAHSCTHCQQKMCPQGVAVGQRLGAKHREQTRAARGLGTEAVAGAWLSLQMWDNGQPCSQGAHTSLGSGAVPDLELPCPDRAQRAKGSDGRDGQLDQAQDAKRGIVASWELHHTVSHLRARSLWGKPPSKETGRSVPGKAE